MLDADPLARPRVRPSRDVSGGEDVLRARLEALVHDDAAVQREAGRLCERYDGANADAHRDDVRLDDLPVRERHSRRGNRPEGPLEVEDDSVLLVQRLHEVADLGTEHPRERASVGRDDVHLDPPLPQRGRHLQADEARADDDGAPRGSRALDESAAVGQRPQRLDVGEVGPGHGEPHRLGPGREEKRAPRQGAIRRPARPCARPRRSTRRACPVRSVIAFSA